ncbi:MAG: multicopper oxidase family protein [Pseudomonadota bacterium]
MKADFEINRRTLLGAAGGCAAGLALPQGIAALAGPEEVQPVKLDIQNVSYRLREVLTENMVSTVPDAPPPVLRMKQGMPFAADVTNTLADASTIHWHGLRVPNKMDGVPYLTQWPIQQGETWKYRYTPDDAGVYWYHSHCGTMEQMARGLTGIIVVEEKEDQGFDGDTVLNLHDFRIGKDDQFMQLYSARAAARAGTLGTLMAANWEQNPIYEHPAGSLIRLRLGATDTTRFYVLTFDGGEGRIIGADGHPLREAVPWPTAEAPIVVAPGQRLDVALRMPDTEGEDIVVTYRTPQKVHPLATLRSTGQSRNRSLSELAPLPPNDVQDFDPAKSEIIEMVFGWSPDGLKPNNGFCGSFGYTFWSIDRHPWPGDAVKGTAPVADLTLGKSYILRLRNSSPNNHPIHLHGQVFRPLRSNKRKLLSNWTDTIVLNKEETVDIGLVADNPGDWAFHCHVIEHQKTGLAGFVRVS